jgi:5-methylcytosine-specific restriction endonuclease McrA
MSRTSEWRSRPLPKDWGRTRRRILRRDGGICYICGHPGANQVDHIIPVSAGGGEEDSNLAAIHEHPCHAAKTAREANARNPRAVSRKRTPEQHPGMIQSAAMKSPSGARVEGAPRKR